MADPGCAFPAALPRHLHGEPIARGFLAVSHNAPLVVGRSKVDCVGGGGQPPPRTPRTDAPALRPCVGAPRPSCPLAPITPGPPPPAPGRPGGVDAPPIPAGLAGPGPRRSTADKLPPSAHDGIAAHRWGDARCGSQGKPTGFRAGRRACGPHRVRSRDRLLWRRLACSALRR